MAAFLKSYAPAAFSGVLLALCFPTFHWFPLAWLALAPLIYVAAGARPGQAALQFFLAGWLFHSVLLQWLAANIFWGGGWALIGYQLLCMLLAVFWGGLGAGWAWMRMRSPHGAGAALLAAGWVLMEWLHANLFTGFGWSALGYSQGPDLPVLQLAALGGVGLISFVLVLVNGLVALAVREGPSRWPRMAAAALVLVFAHGIGVLLLGKPDYGEEPYVAGVIQTDFPQELKWDLDYEEDMVRLAAYWSKRLAQFEPVDLFVWPEAALVRDYNTHYLFRHVREVVEETGAWLFTGATRSGGGGTSYNSAVVVNPAGETAGYYDKVHLAPFGEYMPFDTILPFLRQIVPVDVDAGEEQKVLKAGERSLGPLVCFEVLFRPMSEYLRRQGADTLVVVTNLAWFGRSNAIPQELEVARMRAVETRLPLIHSANTGISGVFDPYGRFQVVDGTLDRSGHYVKWENMYINPSATIMRRRVGALPVAGPGGARLPFGAQALPWLALLAVLALAAMGEWWVRGGKVRPDPKPAAPEPKTVDNKKTKTKTKAKKKRGK